MDPRIQIRHLVEAVDDTNHDGEETFLVLFDLLEERAWDPALVKYTLREIVGQTGRYFPPEHFARLLGVLAETDYPAAVQKLNEFDLPTNDYRSRSLFIDTVNAVHCQRRSKTWQQVIEHEKMEIVTGEQGGDLGPWKVRTSGAEGPERVRPYTVDFPPDYLERELEREFNRTGSDFKTVYYDDGGNFGPGFDETLYDDEGTWRRIRQWAAGREVECPLGDVDDGVVTLEQTYCGEHPGTACALCEAPIGTDHEVVYLGELGGAVFLLDAEPEED